VLFILFVAGFFPQQLHRKAYSAFDVFWAGIQIFTWFQQCPASWS